MALELEVGPQISLLQLIIIALWNFLYTDYIPRLFRKKNRSPLNPNQMFATSQSVTDLSALVGRIVLVKALHKRWLGSRPPTCDSLLTCGICGGGEGSNQGPWGNHRGESHRPCWDQDHCDSTCTDHTPCHLIHWAAAAVMYSRQAYRDATMVRSSVHTKHSQLLFLKMKVGNDFLK